jgi:hypothetical protein
MDVKELGPGLWRWTAPHPSWKPENDKPGGWGRMVASVSYAPAAAARQSGDPAFVLIDPLAPPDGTLEAEIFWRHLDADVARIQLPVAILIGNEFHGRSAQAVFDRYQASRGATIWAHEAAVGALKCRVTNTFGAPQTLPSGIVPHAIANPSPGEVAYYIPARRALVVADAMVGDGKGGVRVVPASWAEADAESQSLYHREFRRSLRTLLDLPIDVLVVSHGEPILAGARDAIEEALGAPAWGEPEKA